MTSRPDTSPDEGEVRSQLWNLLAGFMRTQALAVAAESGRAEALTAYDWEGVARVADIGGGDGTALAHVLSRHE